MAFIANKPVRFDQDYRVGEVIPQEVIEPKMVRKLIEMGKIIEIDLPAKNESDIPASGEPGEMLTGHLDADTLMDWKNGELESWPLILVWIFPKRKARQNVCSLLQQQRFRYLLKAKKCTTAPNLPMNKEAGHDIQL